MRRRSFLGGVATASVVPLTLCQEPMYGEVDPRTADDYGTVRCGQDGEPRREPADSSSISTVEGSWPTNFFDERLTAYNPDATPPRRCPQVQWQAQVEVQSERQHSDNYRISGSPAVVNETCYAHDNENELFAFGATDGEEAWRFGTGRESTKGVTATGETVYVAQSGGVRAIDTDSQEQRWAAKIPFGEGPPYNNDPTAAPTVTDDAICVGTNRGSVRLLDPATGGERWRFEIAEQSGIDPADLHDDQGEPAYMPAWAPAIVDDTVVAPFAVGVVFALDRETGAIRWRTDLDERIASYGGLAVHGDACLVTTGRDLFRIDIADGTIDWQLTDRWIGDGQGEGAPDGLSVFSSPAVTPADDGDAHESPTAFVAAGSSFPQALLRAIDVESGAVRWTGPVAPALDTSACVGGSVVFVSSGSFLVALDRTTGTVLYAVTQYPSEGTVALVDDVVVAADIYGHVYAIS